MFISVYKPEQQALAARTTSVTIHAMRKCLMNKNNIELNKGMSVKVSEKDFAAAVNPITMLCYLWYYLNTCIFF